MTTPGMRQRTLVQSDEERATEMAAEILYWINDLRYITARALVDGDLPAIADVHRALGTAQRSIQRQRQKRSRGAE